MPHLINKEEENCPVNCGKRDEKRYISQRGNTGQPGYPHKTHTRRRERSTIEADYRRHRHHSSASQRLRLHPQIPIGEAHPATTCIKSASTYAKQLATRSIDETAPTLRTTKCRRNMQGSCRRRPPRGPPNICHRCRLGSSKAAPTPHATARPRENRSSPWTSISPIDRCQTR